MHRAFVFRHVYVKIRGIERVNMILYVGGLHIRVYKVSIRIDHFNFCEKLGNFLLKMDTFRKKWMIFLKNG